MNNQNVLALDLATKTGWAVRLRDGSIHSGTYDASSKSDHAGQRFLNFRRFLVDLMGKYDVQHVVYEDVRRHVSTISAHVHGGLKSITLMICCQNSVTVDFKGVGTIKKHWVGKGTASKEQMMLEARRRGYSPTDDNEADALALLSLTMSEYGVMI